jgi:TRAP-type C4-dicarboxylate transport system substrate-binding protein
LIGFGSITWHGLTINQQSWERLPPEVQEILLEVAADYEEQTGTVKQEEYDKHLATLRELIAVNEVDPAVREEWAQSLAEWPQQMASDLDAQGLPGSEVLKLTLEAAEKQGYTWPLRYEIQ